MWAGLNNSNTGVVISETGTLKEVLWTRYARLDAPGTLHRTTMEEKFEGSAIRVSPEFHRGLREIRPRR